MAKILIVDDNPDILDALDLLLTLQGHQVISANDKKHALLAVSRQTVDLVIQDMNFAHGITSGEEGISLFHELRQFNPALNIILITAWTQLETAIELVKAGAADYLQKPWDDIKLLELVTQYTANTSSSPTQVKTELIFQSPEMQQLVNNAERVAKSDVNILITGPNGAGKEKLADFIHQSSSRKDKPFVKVNMGALPAELMEAELFGAEKGAFTGANQQRVGRFEAADGGTLFLDEIGNLSLTGQMKLLRVLQTGEFERLGSNHTIRVNTRVISATNAMLENAVKTGDFREDLFYRLNVIQLQLPPLSQRRSDILPLACHFLGPDITLSEGARNYLQSHHWPGNVRELEKACKRALVFAESNTIDVSDFNHEQPVTSEKQQIEEMLLKHNGVIKYAAQELGLSRQALYRRIEKHGIEVSK